MNFISLYYTKKLIIFIFILLCTPLISFKAMTSESSEREHLIYNCGRNYLENWILDLSHDNKEEIKWNVSGSRLNFAGGYYITDKKFAVVHGIFNEFKISNNHDAAKLVVEKEKILTFLKESKLKTTLSGKATLYSGSNMINGMAWMRINKKVKQKTIFGDDELIEIIFKISSDGFKSTMRTRYSNKNNRIIQFTGTSPLKYKCVLQEIRKSK